MIWAREYPDECDEGGVEVLTGMRRYSADLDTDLLGP